MSLSIVCALSPGAPGEDMVRHPAGGPEAAQEAMSRLYPGRRYVLSGPADPEAEFVAVQTYGPTVLLVGDDGYKATLPDGWGRFVYSYESTAMAAEFEIDTPTLQRTVAMSPGVVEMTTGEPLPFEAPFVQDGAAAGDADTEGLGIAAARWMFGYEVTSADPVDWIAFEGTPTQVLRVTSPNGDLHILQPAAV
ncbi:DUF6928 family protein [Georgenia alba]|uniref:DUF6928 family protein n=1 Tax=Georgenia alba TaxID=2233858 RepID=A0ABW2QI80_9MICO